MVWGRRLNFILDLYQQLGHLLRLGLLVLLDDKLEFSQMMGVAESVKESFTGSKVGTEALNTKVGNWAHFWAEHVRELGLGASQLGILLVEEPST